MTTRTERLEANLEVARSLGAVESYDQSNPTGNKLVWTVKALGPRDEIYALELGTPEAEAFVAGFEAGRRATRGRTDNPIRDAIEAHGYVEVALERPDDLYEQKRLRNRVFVSAYGLGLKGRFSVKTRDGVIHGWRTDVDEDLSPEGRA